MRVMVALLSVLALSCGGKSKSSSGGGIPATTSYAAAGKIGSADVKDSIGFVLTGKEDSELRLAPAKELKLHRIKKDGTVEKVKFMDAQGSEITDAPSPAIVLTPSKKYLVLSFAEEKATYVINIATGAAYKIDKVYAIEAHVQPLYSEDVIFVTHSDSVEDFYEDLVAYMIDMKDLENPVVTMVSAADQGIYLNAFGNPNSGSSSDFRSMLVDKEGNVVYRGFELAGSNAFLRKTTGDYSKLESIPWLSVGGQLQRRDSADKLIEVITGKEITLNYTASLGYVFSDDALAGLSTVCITLEQDGTALAFYDFDGSTCQSLTGNPSLTVTDLSNLASVLQSDGYAASYDAATSTFVLETKAVSGFFSGSDKGFNFQSTGEYSAPSLQNDGGLYLVDKNPFGRKYQSKSVQFVLGGLKSGLVYYGEPNQNEFQPLTNTASFLSYCTLSDDSSTGQNQTAYFKVSEDIFYGKCPGSDVYAYIDLKTSTFYPISNLNTAFLKVKQVSHVAGTKFQIAGTNKQGKYVVSYWDDGEITEGTVFDNPIISVSKIN
jgi:hypothetical protein